MKRITVSLDDATVEQLTTISKSLSVSRSALLNQLLTPALPPLLRLMEVIPAATDSEFDGDVPPDTLRRLRGRSRAVVADAVADAQAGLAELEGLTDEGSL